MISLDISSYDVVSFDIFDTLLLRSYLTPTDLFERMEMESGFLGFASARKAADYESVMRAQKTMRDATIDDAYALMPMKFQKLKTKEMKMEKECLVANAEVVSVWNKSGELGKRRVIMSDMYLPSEFLKTVLRNNGIDGWDGFYVSSDCGMRKSSGQLYKRMLREQAVASGRVLHIGDNEESDVAIPRSMGIQAYHYGKVVDSLISTNPFLQLFLSTDSSLVARRLVASVCVAWHNYMVAHIDYPYWARIGGLLGSVMAAAYVTFIVQRVRKWKIDHLLFVARDGYVLEKIFNVIAPEVRTTYVYAPRLVKNSDNLQVHAEYADYIRMLGIRNSESIAVVDSVSWHFSAQKLIMGVLGRRVFSLSFIAFRKPEHGDCFLFTPNMSLRWCHLVEQFFMANERPIEAVKNGHPVYKTSLTIEEKKRLEVFRELAEAETEVARFLLFKQIEISPVQLLDYIDAFLESMTEEDTKSFSSVKNGVDVDNTDYEPLLAPPHWVTIWRTFKKIPVYRRHYGREGLKMVTRDYLLGFYKFRTIEEDL